MEIMNEDGTMSRLPELISFAQENNLKIVTVKDLIEYRLKRESLVRRVADSRLPTEYGDFKVIVYEDDLEHNIHFALIKGGYQCPEECPCTCPCSMYYRGYFQIKEV